MLKKIGKWNLLIIAVVLGLILSLLNFFVINPSKEYVSASFNLLYSGAEKGEAPNGQPYSVDVIRSEEFLTEVIEKAGLTGKISAGELSANMTVRGSYPSNIIEQIKRWDSLLISDPTRVVSVSDYFPTTFGISIYNDFETKLGKAQLLGLLNTLVDEYKIKYQKIYGAGVEWEALGDLFVPKDRDYMQAVDLLSAKCRLVDEHSQALYKVKQSFDEDGINFLVLSTRAKSIQSSDLQSLSAMITLNALSKDRDALRQKYVYERDIQVRKYNALTTELDQIEGLIESYYKDSTLYLGSENSMITVEGNSEKTYEELIEKKNALSSELTAAEITIRDIESRIEDIDANAGGDAADDRFLSEAIAEAELKIDELIKEFNDLAAAYNKEYASDSSINTASAVYHGNKLVSGSFIKAVIKSEAPLCAVALLVILMIGLAGELRKTSKNKKRAQKGGKAA